jgi:PucR C-terminal helix-turn-helix domain
MGPADEHAPGGGSGTLTEPSAEAQEVIRSIVLRLDTEDLSRRMTIEFRRTIAGYRRLPEPVVTTQIREVAQRNVSLFVACALQVRGPTEEELAWFRVSARDRATEGMPLEDLLAAYRMGGRLAWQALAEAVEPAQQASLVVIGDLVMRYVDEVSSAVAQTYLDERQHLVSEEERRLRELTEAIAGGEPLGPAHREWAEAIGFPLSPGYRAFALHVVGGSARDHSLIASQLQGSGILALTEGDRVTGLLPVDAPTDALRPPGALLALGDEVPRAELAAALDDLRLLVDFATDTDDEPPPHIDPGEYLPELLVRRSPALADQLRRRVLEPLAAPTARPSADLVATLAAFVAADLDRRRAAARLHIHPNTLDHRLRRIQDLTGLRLARPRDLALVVLALSALRVDPATPPDDDL